MIHSKIKTVQELCDDELGNLVKKALNDRKNYTKYAINGNSNSEFKNYLDTRIDSLIRAVLNLSKVSRKNWEGYELSSRFDNTRGYSYHMPYPNSGLNRETSTQNGDYLLHIYLTMRVLYEKNSSKFKSATYGLTFKMAKSCDELALEGDKFVPLYFAVASRTPLEKLLPSRGTDYGSYRIVDIIKL